MKVTRFWGDLTVLACLVMTVRWLAYELKTIDGSLAFLSPGQILISCCWDFLLAAAIGIGAGSLLTVLCLPLLFIRPHLQSGDIAQRIVKATRICAALAIALMLVQIGLQWAAAVGLGTAPSALAWLLRAMACAVAARLLSRATRGPAAAVAEADAGRRTVLTLGAASISAIAIDAVIKPGLAAPAPTRAAPPGAPNILLVTFDSLSATDMSLYGYPSRTAPFLEGFAKGATLFSNFYSCSTFTTPSLASFLTGRYPSETGVYHLEGILRAEDRRRTLFSALREGGYAIAASVGNPYAHPVRLGMDEPSLLTGPPPWRLTPLSGRMAISGQPTLFEMAMTQEGHLWDLYSCFRPDESQYPPARNFAQAEALLAKVPAGQPYFLWVHAFAPHWPYHPRRSYLQALARSAPAGSQARLGYDAFIAECDAELGSFLGRLERKSLLHNTAVLVSADHGESFEGGVYGHGMPQQVLQEIHVPLVIRLPGQIEARRANVVADQTCLAPTILDIAGLRIPGSMKARSLAGAARGEPESGGLAFTQYLSHDSIFRPLRNGTVGVIDGKNQYVLDLATGRGILHSLEEAWRADIDHSADDPAVAAAMRRAIHARFPALRI